jgi:hypothetical protein
MKNWNNGFRQHNGWKWFHITWSILRPKNKSNYRENVRKENVIDYGDDGEYGGKEIDSDGYE